jgi:hypothetical protein
MTTETGENAVLARMQVTGKVESYAYGEIVEKGALFKLINPSASGQVTVTYIDGTTDTDIDASILSDLNAIVKKVEAGTSPLGLVTDFGLYI